MTVWCTLISSWLQFKNIFSSLVSSSLYIPNSNQGPSNPFFIFYKLGNRKGTVRPIRHKCYQNCLNRLFIMNQKLILGFF